MSAADEIAIGADRANASADRTWSGGVRRLFRRLPFIGAGISIAIGAVALAGWMFDHPQWATILPGLPAMTANSGVMAILAGASLYLNARPAASRRHLLFGRVFAAVVVAIAGVTLVEYVFGVHVGIDELISASNQTLPRYRGRPSPQTAAAFALIALSLLSLDQRNSRGRRPAEALALIAGFIPLITIVGLTFGSAALYQPFALYPYLGMGIASAAALLALSVGTVAARADDGVLSILMAEDSGGLAARQLAVWLLGLSAVTGAFEAGARVGFYSAPIGFALIVLFGTVAGSAFVLRLSLRLSRIDRERNAAQQALRESRERFELALRGADLAAWDWNVKSGKVIFNARWAEMRGYELDEITPHVDEWRSGVHPDDRPVTEAALADYLAGRAHEYETEHRVQTKTGDWIWILDRGKVFERDARGQPTRMVGTELDITSRKQLQDELSVAEAKSSGILSISADAIISTDDTQRITSFNAGAEKIFGHASADVIGAPVEMLMPERFRGRHAQHVERFAAAPEASRRVGRSEMAIVGLRKNGEEFPADGAISKLDVGGTRVFTVALRDITAQRQRETETTLLAQVGATLTSSLDYETTLPRVAELAVQSVADVCVVDLLDEGKLRRLSVANRDPSHDWIRDMLMTVPVDLLQEGLVGPVLARQQAMATDHAQPRALAPSVPAEMGRRLLDTFGAPSVVTAPFLAHGKVLGAITCIRSSSTRPYGPADVRLVEALAARTALSIENGQLYGAAQRAVRARDDMMGVVAHDLRNPLGAILMQASSYRAIEGNATEDDDRTHEAFALIERAARRMNRLIQDLLDVTRIEAHRLSVEHERVDTDQLLADVVESQQGYAEAAKLEVRLEVAPNIPAINGDRDRLMQVFENLIGNAIKFTPAGGRIILAAKPQDGTVLFSVSDGGVGIAPENVHHLFDRFWQADKTRGEGAGLGLPIVKGLVEAHGGRIWVESAPQNGSTFYFTIPVAERVATSRGRYRSRASRE